jgi:hypothetical protein
MARGLGASFVQILEPQGIGRFSDKAPELDGECLAILEEAYGRVNFGPGPWDVPILSDASLNARRVGCMGAAQRYLYVDPKGGIRACPFCRVVSGQVQAGNLASVVARLRRKGCPHCPMGLPRPIGIPSPVS